MKKITALLLTVLLCLSVFAVGCAPENGEGGNTTAAETTAEPEETTAAETTEKSEETTAAVTDGKTFSLRIEGNTENIYYGDVEFEEGANLKDALVAFDEANDKITLTGAADDYITAVNGEAAGKFGGWDGWCILLNGESPATGASGITLSESDEVVLYYGDPWGVGMAYPEVKSEGGKLVFTTASGSVAGMKVTLNGKEYTTDANGVIGGIPNGEYSVQIEQYAENGLVTALRFAPDFKITVAANG